MNKNRRADVRRAVSLLEEAGGIIDNCKDDEIEAMENMEGTPLEFTDRYLKITESIDHLEDACDDIESAKDKLLEAIQ